LYLVWQDERTGSHEIFFTKSSNHGIDWSNPIQLTNNSISAINPKIYAFNENIIVIWQTLNDGVFDINYLISSDLGESWSVEQALVENIDCYDPKLTGRNNNIHIVWQEYYGPGWGDIWYLKNQGQNLMITSILPSESILQVPGSINITINGYDDLFNKSDLTCIVQYMINEDIWQDLDVELRDDEWISTLIIENKSINGNLSIKAKLTNPDYNQSDWFYYSNIQLINKKNDTNNTPGFEFISFIAGVLVVVIFIGINLRIKNKKRRF